MHKLSSNHYIFLQGCIHCPDEKDNNMSKLKSMPNGVYKLMAIPPPPPGPGSFFTFGLGFDFGPKKSPSVHPCTTSLEILTPPLLPSNSFMLYISNE